MLHSNNSINETHYEILSVNEDASYEEIRSSYRSAILNYHPDKLQGINRANTAERELGERFIKVQRAWEVLGNVRSRAVYDSELRAMRQDVGIAEDVNLEEMMIEDGGEAVELFYQCRCGDYFSVDSVELEKMGYVVLRNESGVGFESPDGLSGCVVVSCGSCSLQIRLLINGEIHFRVD